MTAFVAEPALSGTSPFARVLVGVDGTPASFEACRQAAVLAEEAAPIEAVAVVHLSDAVQVGFDAPGAVDTLREEAAAALAEAQRILPARATTRFVNGFVTQALLHEIDELDATVIAIGSHGHRRVAEMILGGVAGELIHSAPCSVLVARPERALAGSVVVGVDGSAQSLAAAAAAQRIAARLGVPLEPLVATQGRDVDAVLVQQLVPGTRAVEAHPVTALEDAARSAGLVVVGSRGLHGVRALGSVSERIAHTAECSVLVVREHRTA